MKLLNLLSKVVWLLGSFMSLQSIDYKNLCEYERFEDKFKLTEKYINLRQLQTVPSYIYSTCSSTANYSFDSILKKITRNINNPNDEGYVMLNSEDFLDFSTNTYTTKQLLWHVLPRVVKDGGMFFGVCAFDISSPPSTCINTDVVTLVYFSGISISYFGTDCYHIDQYLNNIYWNTPKHCLSETELTNMTFSFKLDYNVSTYGGNKAGFFITYDGYENYNRKNMYVNTDTTVTPNFSLSGVYPCTYLYTANTSIEFFTSTSYP
jgi:hypothetical protein